MCTLLDPSGETDVVRLSILKNNEAWAQMDSISSPDTAGRNTAWSPETSRPV
jgi:hypothetical protein